jgi:hypothetical protein
MPALRFPDLDRDRIPIAGSDSGGGKSALLTLAKLRIFFERELRREVSLDDLVEVTDDD